MDSDPQCGIMPLSKHLLVVTAEGVGETASQFSPSPGSVHADRTFSLRSVQPHGLQRVMLALFSYHCNSICRFLAKQRPQCGLFSYKSACFCWPLGLIFCLIFHSFHALNQRLIAWVFVAHEYLFGLTKSVADTNIMPADKRGFIAIWQDGVLHQTLLLRVPAHAPCHCLRSPESQESHALRTLSNPPGHLVTLPRAFAIGVPLDGE